MQNREFVAIAERRKKSINGLSFCRLFFAASGLTDNNEN